MMASSTASITAASAQLCNSSSSTFRRGGSRSSLVVGKKYNNNKKLVAGGSPITLWGEGKYSWVFKARLQVMCHGNVARVKRYAREPCLKSSVARTRALVPLKAFFKKIRLGWREPPFFFQIATVSKSQKIPALKIRCKDRPKTVDSRST